MNEDFSEIKGTDVNYFFICKRRAWMSLINFYIIDNNPFVKHGQYLSEAKRRQGFSNIRIGRNEIDNLEIMSDGQYIIHEFKRGKKALKGDIFQVLHYINLLESQGFKVKNGVLHLLGTKSIEIIPNIKDKNELFKVYEELYKLKNAQMPEAIRNYYCNHGCSYRFYCWS
jgi:CRISPR-associated exonuclease Cas4